jgi:predicted phage-related endonuclease
MNKPLTKKQIDNRFEKREALKAQIAELEAQVSAIDDEMKAECQRLGLEYLYGENARVRFALVIKPQFQGKKLKADHPELYAAYTAPTESRPFYFERISEKEKAANKTAAALAAVPASAIPVAAAV